MKHEAIIIDAVPEPVERLAEQWAAWQNDPSFPFDPTHCINGTRMAGLLLAREGVRSKPMSIGGAIYNQFAYDLMEAGVPVSEWPEHAWSIGSDNTVDQGDGFSFAGHLVLEGEGWTLDVSAGQFYRPGKINITGPIAFGANLNTDPHWFLKIKLPGGHVWRINRFPANNAWRRAPGWNRPHAAEIELFDRVASRIP